MMVHMTVKIYNNNDDYEDDDDDDGAPVLVLDGLKQSFLSLSLPSFKMHSPLILKEIGKKSNASRLFLKMVKVCVCV